MNQLVEISSLVETYHAWLREKTALKSIESGWIEITTPFLDRHNDHIQIFVRKSETGYELIDDGETLRDLALSGCTLDSPRRRAMLDVTLNGFGIELDRDILKVRATSANFASKKHNLVQAIASINDLFYLSSSSIQSFFKEDVANWLAGEDIRAIMDVQFTGRTGFQHRFDFAVPPSRIAPERIMRVVNRPSRDAALSIIMAWNDTQDQRPPDSRAVAVLNDNEHAVPAAVTDALGEYSIETIIWSQRAAKRELLAA